MSAHHSATEPTVFDRRASFAVRRAPVLIGLYILALLLLRLSLSPFLEIDEAQFVGHVDWRLVYDNSHPPLYNWLLRLLLEATGWIWPLSTALLKYGLLAAFYLLTWDAARRLAGAEAGLLAVAAAAFLPQIVWQSAHTLAHSIMVLTGSIALAHAAILVAERQTVGRYAWFGVAAALGALAKFNFFLFAAPLLVFIAADRDLRARVLKRGAWIALAVFLGLCGPVLVAAAFEIESSTARLSKLYAAPDGAWYDAPGVGLDGALSLFVASLAWAGPLALVWGLARWRGEDARSGAAPWFRPREQAALPRALGRAMLGGLIVFGLVVLAADMHKVHERYLTPILAALPIWTVVAFPLRGAAQRYVLAGAAIVFVGVLAGIAAMVQTQTHRYAIPYRAIAGEIAAAVARGDAAPAPILARRHSDVANLTLALGWEGSASPAYAPIEDRALLVWRGEGPAPESEVPNGFRPVGAPLTARAPYANLRDDAFVLSFQLLTRR